jgi:protein-S-isoprenylcysteine O-methyltransferase Ste14
MAPLIIVWPYALVFWTVFLWIGVTEWRVTRPTGPATRTPQDAGSLRVIIIGQQTALLLGFLLAFLAPRATMRPHGVPIFCLGIALMLAGTSLRRHCFRMLGKSFTGAVMVRPDQVVVERGAYRWVRHPSYTAGLLIYLGAGLALTNWLSVLALTAPTMAAYGYRVTVEERALVATLGEPYRSYMRRTKRFVPFVM